MLRVISGQKEQFLLWTTGLVKCIPVNCLLVTIVGKQTDRQTHNEALYADRQGYLSAASGVTECVSIARLFRDIGPST